MPTPPETPKSQSDRLVAEMAELAGGLAHELRNPLSTMMVNLKLLAEDLGDDDAHPDDSRRRALLKVEVLRREAERLQSLFDDFLHVAGPYPVDRQDVDINLVITRLVEFFEPTARENDISIHLDLAAIDPHCPADPQLLRQALLNILINAQQAMPTGGSLRIVTQGTADAVTISIADSGCGIPAQDRDRILRPFFSTKASGNGLGLSITNRIVQEHGGALSWESHPGEGTTFTIRLPRDTPGSTGQTLTD